MADVITINATAVRNDFRNMCEHEIYDSEDAKYFDSLSDEDINKALFDAAYRESFWEVVSDVVAEAIDALLDKKPN